MNSAAQHFFIGDMPEAKTESECIADIISQEKTANDMLIQDLEAKIEQATQDMCNRCDGEVEHPADQPADYRGEEGLALLRAHLIGSCCTKCLTAAKGNSGRKSRQRARQLVFCDIAKVDSLDGLVHKLEYLDKGRAKEAAFPLADLMPEDWVAALQIDETFSIPQASKK